MFKTGAGPGGDAGKGTKPKGGYGSNGPTAKKAGTSNKVYSSQQPGQYRAAAPTKGTKPAGAFGPRGRPKTTARDVGSTRLAKQQARACRRAGKP